MQSFTTALPHSVLCMFCLNFSGLHFVMFSLYSVPIVCNILMGWTKYYNLGPNQYGMLRDVAREQENDTFYLSNINIYIYIYTHTHTHTHIYTLLNNICPLLYKLQHFKSLVQIFFPAFKIKQKNLI